MHRERRIQRGAEVGGAARFIAAAIMPCLLDAGRGGDLYNTWEVRLTCWWVSGYRGYGQDPLRVERMLRVKRIIGVWGRGGLLSRAGGGRAGVVGVVKSRGDGRRRHWLRRVPPPWNGRAMGVARGEREVPVGGGLQLELPSFFGLTRQHCGVTRHPSGARAFILKPEGDCLLADSQVQSDFSALHAIGVGQRFEVGLQVLDLLRGEVGAVAPLDAT